MFLGHDFTFGANKTGGHRIAENFCLKNGVNFENLEKFEFDGERVSSSLVRELVQSGNVDKASELLGRHYFVSGRIEKGDGRGRKIGFPTANVGFSKNRIIPIERCLRDRDKDRKIKLLLSYQYRGQTNLPGRGRAYS